MFLWGETSVQSVIEVIPGPAFKRTQTWVAFLSEGHMCVCVYHVS